MTTFHTGPRPFRGERPHAYSQASLSEELLGNIRQFNEAQQADSGLRVLRSLLSQIVRHPAWADAKPILHALNGPDPVKCLPLAKSLLSQTYDSADEQFIKGQIGALVKKYPFSTSRKIAEEAGMRVFTTGERRNRHMNALFRARRDVHAQHDLHWSMLSIRRYIRRVLGDAPRWDTYPGACNWGPGSNVGVTGRFTHFARKLLADEWTVTPACYPYALTLAKRLPMFWDELGFTRSLLSEDGVTQIIVTCVDSDEFEVRFKSRCKFVDYNKISLAKKDADKDRTIASEPLMNQMVQMAFEDDLRSRLLAEGLDLRDQRRNQDYAREGSLGGFNPRCTIDLRNASGSICRELPYDCLPRSWWIALNSCRSPSWHYRGKTTRYHGFVSMGNGFCFPLETLIFAAICNAAHEYCASRPDFMVYGDDIVVRQSEALVVLELLRRYGFAANPDKTFLFGPFRESCGTDWHGGVDVRPVYLDDDLAKLEHRIRAHNAFVRLGSPQWAPWLASHVANNLPSFVSHFVRPWADETDEAIDGRFHMMHPAKSLHWDKTIQCPAWYGLMFIPKRDKSIEGHSRFATALYHAALKGSDSEMPFAERRETLVRVARFSHSGSRSTWEPEAVRPMVRLSSSSLFIRVFGP